MGIKMQLLQPKDLINERLTAAVRLYRVGGHGETKLTDEQGGHPRGIVLGLTMVALRHLQDQS
jgi:hypothetical protein